MERGMGGSETELYEEESAGVLNYVIRLNFRALRTAVAQRVHARSNNHRWLHCAVKP